MVDVLHFTCEFLSAFHTSEYNYANLYTCAPYILGSSLRGAVLRALIDTDCTTTPPTFPAPARFHDTQCGDTCPLKPLFALPTRFSFGWFEGPTPTLPPQRSRTTPQPVGGARGGTLRTRVGIAREPFAAAEGALLSTEVRTGRFTFAVLLPDPSRRDMMIRAVQWAGERPDSGGIGRFRSVGWGRFRVVGEPVMAPLPTVDGAGATRYRFRMDTPYVLEQGIAGAHVPKALLEDQLRRALEGSPGAGPVPLDGDATLRLSSTVFIRRWSDEPQHQGKENRLAAAPGTELVVTFAAPVPEAWLQLWQWGVGEWFAAGFGACKVVVATADTAG